MSYTPPKVWVWNKGNGGRFANINRPVAGATHEKPLPRGRHPLQLYSLGTPNGIKVTILLEELLALGHSGAEYDAWYIDIGAGDQFGSGFVSVNPNSKIPALLDWSGNSPIRVFESGAILTYLAEKFDLKAVLVNPAVVAHLSLKDYVGPQRWLYSGEAFEFTRDHIEELRAIEVPTLSKPQRFWLLAEEGDETLDFRHAVSRYAGARQTVLPGGDHSFTRWNDYLDPIIEFAGLA